MKTPTLLVVDDDYTFSDYIRLALERDGWRVLSCLDPLEAADHAVQGKPDVVLLDFVMPQMNGLELLAWLKDRPETRDIPVVMCSVNMDRKMALEVVAMGGAEALPKPMSRQDILECLQRILPGKK